MLTVLLESDEDLAFADFDENEFFEMGAALDVNSINLVESFGNEVSIAAAAESFGEVCDRAADHDWRGTLRVHADLRCPGPRNRLGDR